MTPDASVSIAPPAGPTGDVAVLGSVLVAAGAAGALTAYAQGFLPDELGSLANSVGTWTLVGFVLALPARRLRTAAVAGALSLAALVAGYYVANELRGFPASSRAVVFWVLAAAVAGPAIGASAHWVRHGQGSRRAVAAGLVPGLLMGEGIYGLTVIADTTYPPYWAAELTAGVAALVGLCAWRLRSVPAIAAAGATAAAVAAAFLVLYSQDLLSLL